MNKGNIIKDRDIVIVGQQPWDVEIGSNCKNIAIEFSKNNRVLYVNSPLDRATKLKNKNDPKVKKRLGVISKTENGIVAIKENLWNYYPDELLESINWITNGAVYKFLNKKNNKKFARSITLAINKLGFKNIILFNDNDIFRCFYLREYLKPAISIYYSRDYLLFVDYWKQHGEKMEPELIKKSDLCVANSTYLANYCKQYNENSFYVGQGCDLQTFTNQQNLPPPADVLKLPGPLIGYVGALQNIRLDIGLLEYIAKQKPEWSIVLVGPEDGEFIKSGLHGLKNVHFLGSKTADSLPSYINSFDVCINPQLINQVTIGNYPRKIDEYLAMGKPVVASRTEAMSAFEEHTYLAVSKEDYVNSIERALKEDSDENRQKRIEFASAHTWENNVVEIYTAINKVEAAKNSLEGKAFVIFSNMRFDSPIEATSLFIARALAKNNKVYYIENPYTFKDYLKNRKYSEVLKKRKLFKQEYIINEPGIPNLKKVALPFLLPLNFLPEGQLFRLLLLLNEAVIVKRIRKVLRGEKIKDFIFINSFNIYYPRVGKKLKPLLTVYQCVDPVITDYDLVHGHVSEMQLVKESDLVICTSKTLFEEKSAINKNTYFVPNAADLSISSKALNDDLKIHDKLQNIPKPIIGYLGTVERRFDYDLLKTVIDDNPDKSFVFAGPLITEHIPDWFFNNPRIFLPGSIPYEEMPRMLKGFDIAIIPFKKDKVSSTIFPLKLFEYIGAGLPVVITDFNTDLKDYTMNTVSFCSDADSFTLKLNDKLANGPAAKPDERLSVAKLNTWEIRTDEIKVLINDAINAKLN